MIPQLTAQEAGTVIRRLVTLLNKQFWEEDTMAEWRELLMKERDVTMTDALGACDEAARRCDTITFRGFREFLHDQRRQRVTLGANTLEGGGRPTPHHLVPLRMLAVRAVAAAVRVGDVEVSETACIRAFDAMKDLPVEELRAIVEKMETGLAHPTILPDWSEGRR